VTEAAKDESDRLTKKLGMTRFSIHSRIVEWLSAQSDQIRAAVLGHLPAEVKGDIARLILKNMRSHQATAGAAGARLQ
jgi:hypothetical protein